jgi:hypothetical protein
MLQLPLPAADKSVSAASGGGRYNAWHSWHDLSNIV